MYFVHQFYSVVHTRHGSTNWFSFSNHLDHLAFWTVGSSLFGVPPADIPRKSHQAFTILSLTAGGGRPPLILEWPPLILCAAPGPLLHCGAARLTVWNPRCCIVELMTFMKYMAENHLPRTQRASNYIILEVLVVLESTWSLLLVTVGRIGMAQDTKDNNDL